MGRASVSAVGWTASWPGSGVSPFGALVAFIAGSCAAACGVPKPISGPAGDAGGAPDGAISRPGPHPPLPMVPIGLDAIRQWDRLPVLRYGVRTYLRSTYDRSGGNEGADASHFLRLAPESVAIALDVAGPGVLTFVRTNHWHGSPWHYVVDGVDHLVSESTTANPLVPIAGSVFLPTEAFPAPLALTWSETRGADLSWVPVPFTRSLTLGYGRSRYGTGYFIYSVFAPGADHLSQAISSFSEEPPAADALAVLASAGTDIAPQGPGTDESTVERPFAAGESAMLADLGGGSGVVRLLRVRASRADALALGRARLRITWDDRRLASVDAPLALFFGAGTLYNRSGQEWLVKGLLSNIQFTADEVILSSYFPMPYFQHAQISITATEPIAQLTLTVRRQPLVDPPETVGYFHATYVDHGPTPTLGKDLIVLDTSAAEGGGDWCGSFAGMSWIFSDRGALGTLEGDPRFFFDDSMSPQAQGTGTEEWGGGGDYWGGANMTLALAGHPTGAPAPVLAQGPEDLIESAYRFLLPDIMPFGKNARIQLEHGGVDDSSEHYQSVAYWYGAPRPCLVRTDAVDIGNVADEIAHAYRSASASAPVSISSRWDWGVDHLDGREIFPESIETGRQTTGTSEVELGIDPANVGVLLRRRLDYAIPDQRAQVWVADASPDAAAADRVFQPAGTWYLAGSNSVVYSNPPGELDPFLPVLETSNRRFREDELLLPRALTEGRSRIRLRFVSDNGGKGQPLLPDAPAPPSAWSELGYAAYCYLLGAGR